MSRDKENNYTSPFWTLVAEGVCSTSPSIIRMLSFCDGRHFVVNPDVVADFRHMPYPDNTFRLVVFHPAGWQEIKYGSLPNADWKEMLRLGFKECFRVLINGGFLIFKWNDTDKPVDQILKLTDQRPVFGHLSGKRSNTHWIVFMKK